MEYKLKIMAIDQPTLETKRLVVVKPKDFKFIPGKSINVSIPKPGLENQSKAIAITSPNSDYYFELIFKEFRRDKFDEALNNLRAGEEIVVSDITGNIEYKGRGVFIAYETGILPFISIFRELKQDDLINGNVLMYSTKNRSDLILERELKHIFGGKNVMFLLSREKAAGYEQRRLDLNFLKEKINDFNQEFYIAGPENFVNEIRTALLSLGAQSLNTELIEQ
jgi:ferredoxin-NADP reductase